VEVDEDVALRIRDGRITVHRRGTVAITGRTETAAEATNVLYNDPVSVSLITGLINERLVLCREVGYTGSGA